MKCVDWRMCVCVGSGGICADGMEPKSQGIFLFESWWLEWDRIQVFSNSSSQWDNDDCAIVGGSLTRNWKRHPRRLLKVAENSPSHRNTINIFKLSLHESIEFHSIKLSFTLFFGRYLIWNKLISFPLNCPVLSWSGHIFADDTAPRESHEYESGSWRTTEFYRPTMISHNPEKNCRKRFSQQAPVMMPTRRERVKIFISFYAV